MKKFAIRLHFLCILCNNSANWQRISAILFILANWTHLCFIEIVDDQMRFTNEIRMTNRYRKSSLLRRESRDDFLDTMASVFRFTKWFGIPTYGGYLALLWTIITFTMMAVIEVYSVWKVIKLLGGWSCYKGGVVTRLSGALFYGNGLFSLILSWRFIASWRSLSFHWRRAEANTGLFVPSDSTIRKRLILVTTFISICAIVEHIMSMMSATGFDIPPLEFLQIYIMDSHGFLLHNHEYNLWVAIPIFVISKTATILWNFQDLIIILISMGLTSRYHRLNQYVRRVVKYGKRTKDVEKFGSEGYIKIQSWRKLREAYVRQADLVRRVDRELGLLVLLSNASNLYFICLQLFLGFHKDKGTLLNKCYYFYSLGWMLFRACSVVLAAANVNVYSRKALPYLNACPGTAYNVEVKRLQNQLSYDLIALHGMGFFSLNREMLLEVAATVVKYELVLFQYDK